MAGRLLASWTPGKAVRSRCACPTTSLGTLVLGLGQCGSTDPGGFLARLRRISSRLYVTNEAIQMMYNQNTIEHKIDQRQPYAAICASTRPTPTSSLSRPTGRDFCLVRIFSTAWGDSVIRWQWMRVMIWIAAMVSSAMRRPSTRQNPQLRKMGQISGGPGPEAHI